MSVCATQATWELKNVTPSQKLLLLTLADRADESGECWPSLRRIQEDTGLNRKTIVENRQHLICKSLISYTGEFKGKQKQIPVMILNYVIHREGNLNLDNEENFTSTEIGTGTENGTRTSTENGTRDQYRKRDTEPNSLLNLKEEPKNSIVDSSNATSEINFVNPKKSKPITDYYKDELFMAFYNAYPKKQKPRVAYKAFLNLKADSSLTSLISNDVQNRLENDDHWQDKKYIPFPATYLNSRQWEGEITSSSQDMQAAKLKIKKANEERAAQMEKNSQAERDKQFQNTKDGLQARKIIKTITNNQMNGLKDLKNAIGIGS